MFKEFFSKFQMERSEEYSTSTDSVLSEASGFVTHQSTTEVHFYNFLSHEKTIYPSQCVVFVTVHGLY